MDSILTSVKKTLGIVEEYTHFDPELILHINSVFMILNQLGVGPEGGFSISDASAVWSDFFGERTDIDAVKTYMGLKVRLLFDTTASSAVIESLNKSANELEWRINVQAEA